MWNNLREEVVEARGTHQMKERFDSYSYGEHSLGPVDYKDVNTNTHTHTHTHTKCLTEEVFIGGYCCELLLEGVTNLVLCGQEHREVLGLLKALGVTHHLQELSSSAVEKMIGVTRKDGMLKQLYNLRVSSL